MLLLMFSAFYVLIPQHIFAVKGTGCVGFGAIGVLEESENRFRASSVWHNKTIDFSAKYGRLNGNRAWCPNRNLSQWLQIDLGATYRVCGVATQGKALWTPVWVTKYKIYFSNNNVTWKIYIQNGTMEFMGNKNGSSVVYNSFTDKFTARFVRFQPTAFQTWPCLRVEVNVELRKPRFTLSPRRQLAVEGQDVNFTCSAVASPSPSIHWTFNNRNITVKHDVIGWNLTLYSVQNSGRYEGRYACVAGNIMGTVVSSSAVLLVYAPPIIVNRLETTKTLLRGKTATFSCNVTGDPPPSIKWKKVGGRMSRHAEIHNGGRVLIIKELQIDDSGVYECAARNSFGHANISRQLLVVGAPIADLKLSRTTVFIKTGLSANLGCYVINNQNVHFHWTKDGRNITDGMQTQSMHNVLIVTPVTQDDFGTYICHATNLYGTINISITVQKTSYCHGTESGCPNSCTSRYSKAALFSIIPLAVILLLSLSINGYLLVRFKQQRNLHLNENNVTMSEIQEDRDACTEDPNTMSNEIAWDNLIPDDGSSVTGLYSYHNASFFEDTDGLLQHDEVDKCRNNTRS